MNIIIQGTVCKMSHEGCSFTAPQNQANLCFRSGMNWLNVDNESKKNTAYEKTWLL